MPRNRESNLLAVLADAEQAALEHVGWLRAKGVPLEQAAEAIGLDPANVRGWDDITHAYTRTHRDLFNCWDAEIDGRGVPL